MKAAFLMGNSVFVREYKKYFVFLNVSFLVVASVFLFTSFTASEFVVLSSFGSFKGGDQEDCHALEKLDDYKAKCLYLKSHNPCVSQGYIDYLLLFYCNFGGHPFVGYCLLFLWLLVLFYLLGNTASEYFCSSLDSLSRLLKLSPIIAGVTLLSLGNGAPDVFASLASFMGNGTGDIGINTVLGGAFFVICVVVGIISICLHGKHVRVNKYAFVRDISFFLLVLGSLFVILIHGKINLWGAIGFSSMYVVYVIAVYISAIRYYRVGEETEKDGVVPSVENDLSIPILTGMEERESNCLEEGTPEDETSLQTKKCCICSRPFSSSCTIFLCILEMPLCLPRRLTIPVVCEKKWSKPIAVTSVTLAPLLFSVVWNPEDEDGTFNTSLIVYGTGLLSGIVLGIVAYVTTEESSPPKRCLFPWLAGGFLMSVVWSYITAEELVALLVSLGYILGIKPSILGLTVLAWGNSLGDFITNLTMALNGGPEGAQIAISGCYAGPIFNILFGLGFSLVGSCWYAYPSSVEIPEDPYLLETLGFLLGALIWALVVLPMRGMRLDVALGGGLLGVYLISMSLRLIQTLGSLQFHIQS